MHTATLSASILQLCILSLFLLSDFAIASVQIMPQAATTLSKAIPVTRTITVINPLTVEARIRYMTPQNPAVTSMIKPHTSLTITILKDSVVSYSLADGSNIFTVTPGQIVHDSITLTLPSPSAQTIDTISSVQPATPTPAAGRTPSPNQPAQTTPATTT